MRPPERPLNCKRTRVLLDAHIDGELPAERTASVERHVAACCTCRDEMLSAQRLRAALRQMPPHEMPRRELPLGATGQGGRLAEDAGAGWAPLGPATSRGAFAGESARAEVTPLRPPVHRTPLWRPLAVAAVLAGLVLGAVRVFDRPTETPVTTAEVARAELQVRWVLARLGEINRRTSDRVRDEVIEQGVVGPSARAVENAFDRSVTQ
jgi:anti-sigma factor RsiW